MRIYVETNFNAAPVLWFMCVTVGVRCCVDSDSQAHCELDLPLLQSFANAGCSSEKVSAVCFYPLQADRSSVSAVC